jgi:hypothetical protein
MRSLIWGIVGLCGLGAAVQLIGVHGATDERAAIRRAVRAPFQDLRRRDASALCADFTSPVAAHLVAASGSCPSRVDRLFQSSRDGVELVPYQSLAAKGRGSVTAIHWAGDRAWARSPLPGATDGSRRWQLLREGGRWRISTPMTLSVRSDCNGHLLGTSGCVAAYSIGLARD